MFASELPSLRFNPVRYRPDGVGSWSGHIPFACDLVRALRPSLFVELGTYYGESYFAFCQAVAEAAIACTCNAVDTWRGDQNVGPYGEEVFEEVQAHNLSLYSSFSTLIRESFDDACQRYEPESIDLLHIDGDHSYEAVSHDFRTWLPKLRPGGIALLHDISVQRADFGVWRLWAELESEFRTFAFLHSSGLGVVLKPGLAPESGVLKSLFGDEDPEPIRVYYEMCAERLERRRRESELGKSELITQLFWRGANESFSEVRSTRAVHSVGPENSSIRLQFPPVPGGLAELRLDLSEKPALLLLSRISVSDNSGRQVWEFSASVPDRMPSSGLEWLPAQQRGALVNIIDNDSSMLLPIDAAALKPVDSGGGAVEVTLALVEPAAYLGEISTRLVRSEEEVRRLEAKTWALESERASILQRSEEQALQLDEQNLRLQDSGMALERAERRLSELESRLHSLSADLEASNQRAHQLECDRDLLQQTIADIHRSLTWHLTRPMLELERRMRRNQRES